MEQAADILKVVETPLQLAALALLVFYGVAKAMIASNRWAPSDALVRLLVNRAFLIGLIVLIPAVGGPLLAKGFDQDDLIDGTVLSPDGSSIPNAIVSARPGGAQPVNLSGSYELRVPQHIKRKQYVVTASAAGFKPDVQVVREADIGAVDFTLQPQPIHAVREISPEIVIGQFYGVPFAIVSLSVESPGQSRVWISDANAQLSNGRAEIGLTPHLVTTYGYQGPYAKITGMLPIDPGAPATMRIIMAPNADADVNRLITSIASLPEFRNVGPCVQSGLGAYNPLTDQAFDMIQVFARDNFVWTEGNWTLKFQVTAGDRQDRMIKPFQLSAADVENLKDSIKLVRACKSIIAALPLAQEGMLSNYLLR